MSRKMEYYICLFLYALKDKKSISKNTLFRYVYIFDIVSEYLGDIDKINDEIIIDKDMGLGNVVQLTESLNEVCRMNLATISASTVVIENELVTYVNEIKNREKVKNDLNKIMYFVSIVSSYNEDVILSAFFNDPNVDDALSRGKKEIRLNDNKLKQWLEEFEQATNNRLGKYDVFSSWLDYVFEEYIKEKETNG